MHDDNEGMESEIQEKGLTTPRITLEYIITMLGKRVTYRFDQPTGTTNTFAHAFLDDAFYLATGRTACVSLDNFDAEMGRKYAQQNARKAAIDKLFELEGYWLYKNLNGSQP